VRVEGDNQAGIAAALVEKLAQAGINLRGVSAAVIGERFIMYIGLDNVDAATRTVEILREA
jgi:predicted amino acid-binding ACT domain protein